MRRSNDDAGAGADAGAGTDAGLGTDAELVAQHGALDRHVLTRQLPVGLLLCFEPPRLPRVANNDAAVHGEPEARASRLVQLPERRASLAQWLVDF